MSNLDLYYRAISFYLEEQPMQLSALLQTLIPKIDHARAVQQLRKAGHLALIMPYLKQANLGKIKHAAFCDQFQQHFRRNMIKISNDLRIIR